MAEFTNIIIGIQARSTSKRFPRKVFETIGGKPMVKHVIEACERAASYMNNYTHRTHTRVSVVLVVPYKDELCAAYKKSRTPVIEGPEDDVLGRYKIMSDKLRADYIVRVTADCPLIPPYLITKHIKTATINGYDYVSNVDERVRTAADGMDCEVISQKLLDYMYEQAAEPQDREHVTLLARRSPPDWAKIAHVIGFYDQSDLKLSVDTPEDLERVRAAYDRVEYALSSAEQMHGKQNVHRF